MSGDMLTHLLNESDKIEPMVTFHDFYIQKWNEEVTPNCDIREDNGICRFTGKICSYNKCYRRAKFHVDY